MRKYQQLLLLLISAFSVIILILYKNENNRLKDVLHVVNIFGRSDEAVLKRLENNNTQDDDVPQLGPLPVWQALSDSFHAYAAFWNRNDLMAGGEVIAMVVGKKGVVVNFGCVLLYDGQRSIRGKLQFQRVDGTNEDDDSEFTIYNFFCRIVRDFGIPESVIFNDLTNSKHTAPEIRIRYIKSPERINAQRNILNVCVDLATPNRTTKFMKNEMNLIQFFLHHQGLGIQDFLVYNGDQLSQHVLKLLRRFNMRLHMMPFNFPFTTINGTERERVRRIIETDCLVRNTKIATFTLFLEPNEFFYPNARLESPRSVLRSIHQYAGEIDRFELPSFAVCIDEKQKLLIDSALYDPESKAKHKLFVYRAHVPITTTPNKKSNEAISKTSVSLSLSMALAHRYIDCVNVGKDGLHDWRNPLRADFMYYLQEIRSELDIII